MVSIGGHTVLHLASANRHCDVVKRLVEAGARVNVRNAHGNTPLHSAAATGTVDVLLVSCCASILAHSLVESAGVARHDSKGRFSLSTGTILAPAGVSFFSYYFFLRKNRHHDVS